MLVVPVQSMPNQQIQAGLNNQAVTLNVYQNDFGLFMDVYLAGVVVITGVICWNCNLIVRDAYLGFVGDFIWFDTSGNGADPVFTGIGSRFILLYLTPQDVASLVDQT
jgi:hypothetical protein